MLLLWHWTSRHGLSQNLECHVSFLFWIFLPLPSVSCLPLNHIHSHLIFLNIDTRYTCQYKTPTHTHQKIFSWISGFFFFWNFHFNPCRSSPCSVAGHGTKPIVQLYAECKTCSLGGDEAVCWGCIETCTRFHSFGSFSTIQILKISPIFVNFSYFWIFSRNFFWLIFLFENENSLKKERRKFVDSVFLMLLVSFFFLIWENFHFFYSSKKFHLSWNSTLTDALF